MKTPAGKDCRYYYEDFHRGRNEQECRLIKGSGTRAWHPSDCESCPVPDILRANASEHLELRAEIKPGVLGFGRSVSVVAWCRKHSRQIEDAYVGCKLCNEERAEDLSVFFQ